MSAGELKRSAGAMVPTGRPAPFAHPAELVRRLARAAGRLARGLIRAAPDLLALELLAAANLLLFRDALERGLVFHEADTSTMFYPVFAALHAATARGELLLWAPGLFTGFPLLAEGQTGVLYPPNQLAARLLPVADGFIWLRIGHFAAGALFAYLFGRALRLAPGPAAILALSFTYGSYLVGQMQHASVVASAVWLPLVLALTELGLRGRPLVRLRCLVLAALALSLASLGVHGQTVVMSGACFVGWVLFRMILPVSGRVADSGQVSAAVSRVQARAWRAQRARIFAWSGLPALGRAWIPPAGFDFLVSYTELGLALRRLALGLCARLGSGLIALLVVPTLSMAVAAAQLLPLWELSGQSGRAGAWSYQAATDYSLPVPNLITLLFPFFFRDGAGGGWALWQPWEVTYYAGVVPLALALFGLASTRRREVLFFAVLLVGSTLLALGDYSPLNLYAQIWNWPGFNLNRAPARYSYLGVLALAALAGLGSQTLWENLRTWPSGARRTLRSVVAWIAILAGALGLLLWHLVTWRAWLERQPDEAARFLAREYLGQRHDPGAVDSVQEAYAGLWRSLDLSNPDTARTLFLLGALLLLVVCWNEFRRARGLWQGALVLLVAADLVSFAQAYHPELPIQTVADIGPAGRYLARQPGLPRVYTSSEVRAPKPNVLLPWGVAEVRAYDPLELGRHGMFVGTIDHADNWLLDLVGARFRIVPAAPPSQPSYRQTAFNPQHPLVTGSAVNPSGRGSWLTSEGPADELRIISALEDGFGVPDGEAVGEWRLTDSRGREYLFVMRAGRDTAEWSYDDPVYTVRPAHSRATVAFSYELPRPLPSGASQVNLYYSAFPLLDRPRITRAEFRQTLPGPRLQIFGFGLFERQRGQVAQFFDREKYRRVYQDSEVAILENRSAFPRAYAVPEAIVSEGAESTLQLLAHGALDPHRQVVLEEAGLASPAGQWVRPRAPGDDPNAAYGEVRIVDYRAEEVAVQVETDGGYLVLTDAYYPGWQATLDGEPTDLLRANFLFRAVPLPPGQHLVQLQYRPDSFLTGASLSRIALLLAGLALLVSLTPRRLTRWAPGRST